MGFNLPEELLLSLNDAIPCRELQIRQLHALLGVRINLTVKSPPSNPV